MVKDGTERRLYRKSPGRQYGYEYDPLHSQSLTGNGQQAHSSTSFQSDLLSTREGTGTSTDRHTSGLLDLVLIQDALASSFARTLLPASQSPHLSTILANLIQNCAIAMVLQTKNQECMKIR